MSRTAELDEGRERRRKRRQWLAAEVVRLNREMDNPTIARRHGIGLRTVERILSRYRKARRYGLDHDDAVLWASLDRRSDDDTLLGDRHDGEGTSADEGGRGAP